MAVTLALIVLFSLTIKGFATLGNLSVILSNSTSLVILDCGMAVVIISRGLDLSQVAAMVAGATTFSTLINAGLSGPSAIILAVIAMALVGLANGWLIAFVEIPAMLATLASAMFVTGLFRFAVLRGKYLLILPKSNPAVVFFNSDILPGLTAPVALMIVTLIVTWLFCASRRQVASSMAWATISRPPALPVCRCAKRRSLSTFTLRSPRFWQAS